MYYGITPYPMLCANGSTPSKVTISMPLIVTLHCSVIDNYIVRADAVCGEKCFRKIPIILITFCENPLKFLIV